MDVSDEETAEVAAVTEDQDHIKQQHLRGRGSSNSRVVVYDCRQKTVRVQNKKKMSQYSSHPLIRLHVDVNNPRV